VLFLYESLVIYIHPEVLLLHVYRLFRQFKRGDGSYSKYYPLPIVGSREFLGSDVLSGYEELYFLGYNTV
jgi:hypothetical protein